MNQRLVSFRAGALQILQEPPAPGHHGQQAASRVMVLLMRLEMLGELADPLTQDRDLHLRGTRVGRMHPVQPDHSTFDVSRQCHLEWMLLVFSLSRLITLVGYHSRGGRFWTIFDAGIDYGIIRFMGVARKITIEVPPELLEKAQRASGAGITQTIRTGLQLVAASQAYAQMRRFRGKVRFTRTLAELKTDR